MVVIGSAGSTGRAELLRVLGEIRALDRFESDRFIGGHPLRILARGDEAAAHALAEKLRGLGAVVTVEPSPPEFAMPSDISLVTLDDGSDAAAALPAAPQLPAPVAGPADESLFQAPPIAETVMELDAADLPVRPLPESAPTSASRPSVSASRPSVSASRPSVSGSRAVAAPVIEEEPDDDEAFEPVPGRLLQGSLRRQPGLRVAIGVVLGLLIGFALSAPYQSRAQRRVAQIRAAADADRYRPVDEARANAARLDEEADDLASSAFLTTLVIWLGAGGAVVLGWHRLT